MTAKQIDILARSIALYGNDIQSTVAMEECAELIQAVSKVLRYTCWGKYRENLVEEMADVTIILQELMLIYDIADYEVQDVLQAKIKRIERRMKTNS